MGKKVMKRRPAESFEKPWNEEKTSYKDLLGDILVAVQHLGWSNLAHPQTDWSILRPAPARAPHWTPAQVPVQRCALYYTRHMLFVVEHQ
jgi:hypothetical protein